ncbi:leucyl/phenylalanyl-tRNA--protein transferase [Thalassolituus pacificus]|uniref:Leucyl/phenylalanyl-tRNA--protein transferase n=1 Tax=Thalassolituus pacificus TaxID=2975440 RepID=A0A9X2WG46_9GAMM|nr:leucyl/phenylalanyl-tRNA--protein transferase [Thalassolituus pacificus]MCT7359700.1 leucyl/phenylalanyl-tRNA--protein transferase [Thalassolituus pacificus]
MIDWLDEVLPPVFPATSKALTEPNGLLAAGGQVSPLWADSAYRKGIFPWNDPSEARLWWSPAPRAVITPESFHLPRTVRKLLRRETLNISTNMAFDAVIQACAQPRDYESGTWISDEIIDCYSRLQRAGRAFSVECWSSDGDLCGGFYGLTIGSAVFGESMFSRRSNASKLAFATAAPVLFNAGVRLIDCQMKTDHLGQFGLIELDRTAFESALRDATGHTLQLTLPGWLS